MLAKTHPVYASLDHPLFCCAGKRGLNVGFQYSAPITIKLFKPLFPTKLKRGMASAAKPG
jgi:hypothetical protein